MSGPVALAQDSGPLPVRRGLTLPSVLSVLLAGLPLLLWSVWAARRGSLRGLLLWLGALFYFAYSYAYYVLNPEFNALYLAYVAIVSMSGYALLFLLLGTDAEAMRVRFTDRTPTRLVGGFLVVLGALFALQWVSRIVAALGSGTTPTRVERTVWPMDLVIALPAVFWGGVWLWRRQPLGYVVAGVLLLKLALLGLSLVLDTWLVTLWGRPPTRWSPSTPSWGWADSPVRWATCAGSPRPRHGLRPCLACPLALRPEGPDRLPRIALHHAARRR
jgi:hypothetical protein